MPVNKRHLWWVLMVGALVGCQEPSVSDEVDNKLSDIHAVSTPTVTINEPIVSDELVSFNAKNNPFISPFVVREQAGQTNQTAQNTNAPPQVTTTDTPTTTSPEQIPMPKLVLGKKVSIDPQRPRQVLEHYALSGLKYQGRMEQGGRLMAIVISPDGVAHRVQVGQYIGQHHGKITHIDRRQITIAEAYLHSDGRYYERVGALRFAHDESIE